MEWRGWYSEKPGRKGDQKQETEAHLRELLVLSENLELGMDKSEQKQERLVG